MTSPAEYERWIDAYVEKHRNHVRGKCAAASRAMVEKFPELRLACGFAHWQAVHRPVRDQHWWCVAPDGAVVDPTASQFVGHVRYEELDLDKPEDRARIPTGRCMECGADAYGGNSFCTEACEKTFCDSFNAPREPL